MRRKLAKRYAEKNPVRDFRTDPCGGGEYQLFWQQGNNRQNNDANLLAIYFRLAKGCKYRSLSFPGDYDLLIAQRL